MKTYIEKRSARIRVGIYKTKDLDEISALSGIPKDKLHASGDRSANRGTFALEVQNMRGHDVRCMRGHEMPSPSDRQIAVRSWDFRGTVLAAFNGSATGNGLDLERPKVVRCAGTGKYVMWVRGTGEGNTPQLLAVATSDTPTGPFTFEGNGSDPFHTVFPNNINLPEGYQYADATLFQERARSLSPIALARLMWVVSVLQDPL